MASYHCSVKVGSKGKAGSHAEYIAREGKYKDGKRREDLEATDAGNMPKWAEHKPAYFWQAADEHERVNGATYREIQIALPRELTEDQRRDLVEEFIKQEIGDRHAYQWAIHTPKAALEGDKQPHAHIMYSERTRDGIDRDPEQYFKRYNAKAPERGGCRKDSAGTEERLQATRERWADLQNAHLEKYGHEARVDHRSLQARGISREPEKHIGPSRIKDLKKQDATVLLAHRAAQGELEGAKRQAFLQQVAFGIADARARFELTKQIEAGKNQARENFQRLKAEKEQEAARVRQKQEAEAKRQAEREQQRAAKRDRGMER